MPMSPAYEPNSTEEAEPPLKPDTQDDDDVTYTGTSRPASVSKALLSTQMDLSLPRIPRKKLAPCFDPTICEPVIYSENAPAWDMYAHWELEPIFETPKPVMRQIENDA